MLATFLGFLALFAMGGAAYAFCARRPRRTRPRLTVWHRSAIVLSVVWFFGIGLWVHEDNYEQAQRFSETTYRLCSESRALHQNYNFSGCMDEALRDFWVMLGPWGGWDGALLGSVLGVLLAWLSAYICLWTMRWILRGRQQESTA